MFTDGENSRFIIIPPPKIGTEQWKRSVVQDSIGKDHQTSKVFDCGDLGIFVWHCRGGGSEDYFWVERKDFVVIPAICWPDVIKICIGENIKTAPEKK